MYLGKAICLGRLFNDVSGHLLAIILDHAIARGVLPGLVNVESAVASVAAGKPDATTLQKGGDGVTWSVGAGGLGKQT